MEHSEDCIELSHVQSSHDYALELETVQETHQAEREQVALPPTDGGYQAWLLLTGCFVINILIWCQ